MPSRQALAMVADWHCSSPDSRYQRPLPYRVITPAGAAADSHGRPFLIARHSFTSFRLQACQPGRLAAAAFRRPGRRTFAPSSPLITRGPAGHTLSFNTLMLSEADGWLFAAGRHSEIARPATGRQAAVYFRRCTRQLKEALHEATPPADTLSSAGRRRLRQPPAPLAAASQPRQASQRPPGCQPPVRRRQHASQAQAVASATPQQMVSSDRY